MSVNGVTGSQNTTTYSSYSSTASASQSAAEESTKNESGVVYEPSKNTQATKKYKPDANMVAKLKADADARTSQMKSLVEKMFSQQTNAYGKANDMWKFIASGKYEVDGATKLQAQADIAEDGYYGVSQTSQRILDFATALTGGDPDKIEEMRAAFKKGYEQAEKTWGGKLPEISSKTYDAVMSGFDKLAKEAGIMS